jgi:serine/threonine protein kinase
LVFSKFLTDTICARLGFTESLIKLQRAMPRQDGGKLLGEGVYGCAFNPPLNCILHKKGDHYDKKNKNQKVGKLTWPTFSENEIFISQVLKQAPDYKKYFILIENHCVPESRSQQKEKDLGSCKFIKELKVEDTIQLIMPFGGKPLFMVPKNTKNINFFALFRHLLEAGTILLKERVVHADLHVMNILVDNPRTAKIIDFGMAWQPDALTLANLSMLYRQYNPRVAVEPPEISYLNGILEKIKPSIIFANIHDQKLPLHLIKALYGIPIEDQIRNLKKFVNSSWSMREENWFSFYKLYWSSIDSWGIGISMMSTFVDMTMDPSFETTKEYSEKSDNALQTLLAMCSCDPGKRLDCAEALAMFAPDSEILKMKEVRAHLEEKRKVRKGLVAL